MYIGRLNSPASGVGGGYYFYRRGTKTALTPDILPAWVDITGPVPFVAALDGRAVGWKWSTVMDVGVDIAVDFSEECFIGSVCLALAPGSAVSSVEVFASGAAVGRCDAATGGTLEGELEVPVGVRAGNITVRLNAALKDICVTQLEIIGAARSGCDVFLYPQPAKVKMFEGSIALADIGEIRQDGSADAAFAAGYLSRRLEECFGLTPGSGGVPINLYLDDGVEGEGYSVRVSAEGIELRAARRLSLLYAVETLAQLASSGEYLPYCQVVDAPYKPMRGFHFGLPPREDMEFARRVIRYVLIPMRYNLLIIEFAGGMRFDRHPEISEAWVQGNRAAREGEQPAFPHGEMVAGGGLLEKDEVRGFVEYAKQFGFEVVPEVQSLAHVQYITYAHPEIAEVAEATIGAAGMDTRAADQPPSEFYAHSYCPRHEDSYRLIYDIIDEIVEVVRPERYVHMGHDEVYQLALCPRCKGADPAELYLGHVTKMYEYLRAKGLSMMIWSDMLQPTERYGTHPAAGSLPRDILMLDFIWYFHFDLDMEDHILPFGYQVMMGNLYSSHYPRYESRAAKPGMVGGQVSLWCRFDEYNLAKKGKLYDLLYTANMLWSPAYDSRAREVYADRVAGLLRYIRHELRGIAPRPHGESDGLLPLNLPAAPDPNLPPEVAATLTVDLPGFDLAGARKLGRQPLSINVGDSFSRLVFLHATDSNCARVAWQPLERIGRYVVKYADGGEVEIPVEYAGNIAVWSRRYGQPLPQQYYRHQGYIATYLGDPVLKAKTHDGRDVTALAFEWVNPRPESEIESVLCCSSGEGVSILLLGVSGVK